MSAGPRKLTAPGLLSAAMRDRIDDLPAVRPHQRQAVHAFFAQLGALALVAGNERDAPETEEDWSRLLRALTAEFPDDAPWCLVVEDVTKPALLQPPILEGRIEVLKERELTPDALDMLVTSKNHDLKAERMRQATAEHWLLALLTLQTMEGFLGAGNYGIARMNGGFASRAMVGTAPPGGWGARLRRDILALAADHARNAEEFVFPARGGKALLWLEPWNGRSQLTLDQLDPYFIEICRRVRLVYEDGTIVARRGTTEKARIATDKTLGGKTGDPWSPAEASKVLTVDGEGFNYRRVSKLIDPSVYQPAPLQKVRREDGSGQIDLVFLATARGQGGTDGFHERRIRVPPAAASRLRDSDAEFAKLAQDRVKDAGDVRRRVLNRALFILFQNAPEQVNYRHVASETKAAPFLAAFDAEVDRIFFDELFIELQAEDEETRDRDRRNWLTKLETLAREQLFAAEAATPRSGIRRDLAVAAARDALGGLFRHVFPEMKEPRDDA